MRNVLLLTATVTPPSGVPALQRTDPAQRLRDYEDAFAFYLPMVGTTFESIVFAENSASDISSLRQMVARSGGDTSRVDFLSFYGLDHPAAYGRGYGEFKLVDHAMNNAPLLRDDAFVWKCTGRYKIANIVDLVRSRPANADIYCHFRDFPYRLCELFLLSFNRHGFRAAIEGAYKSLRNDVMPGVHSNEEVAFRKLADSIPAGVKVVRRFNRTPIVEGKRGWDNSAYSGKWHPKIALRRVAGLVAPWVWI